MSEGSNERMIERTNRLLNERTYTWTKKERKNVRTNERKNKKPHERTIKRIFARKINERANAKYWLAKGTNLRFSWLFMVITVQCVYMKCFDKTETWLFLEHYLNDECISGISNHWGIENNTISFSSFQKKREWITQHYGVLHSCLCIWNCMLVRYSSLFFSLSKNFTLSCISVVRLFVWWVHY